jgi:eukaryotic-like serine/threonine-protein kinase
LKVSLVQPSPVGPKIRFGLFEVDLAASELRRRGRKVMLQGQPFQVLALLVGRPGEVVTREELQQALWPRDTFVEFDKSLNKAIQKLRQALGDSADNPRFIETLPRKGYRFITPIERLADGAAGLEAQIPAIPVNHAQLRKRQLLWLSMAGVVLAAGAVFVWGWLFRPSGNPPLVLTQLTTDTGLTYQPSISPDGKLMAYASDRGGEGKLDIWVQQVPRGEPIQVTHDEADDYEPSFSPDGRSIVFRSNRDGGGVYVVPTLGGEARKIVDQGRQPRYSPDGAWLAYWVGGLNWGGLLYVVPSVGGQARQLSPAAARSPVWAPDGKHVLFRTPTEDWYVVPLGGGPAVKTGVVDVLLRRGFSVGVEFQQLLRPDPELWLTEGNSVMFSATTGDSTGLWKIPISPKTWQVAGAPQRLTVGTGVYSYASASADGRIFFSSLTRNPDVWGLPIDTNRGKVTGEMQQLTHNVTDDLSPSVSADGKRMVFESNRTGKRVVWTKDLVTGKEKALTDTSSAENLPIISADGSEVVYLMVNLPNYDGGLRVIPFEGGPSKKVLDGYYQPFQWSSDKSKILYVQDGENGFPSHLRWLDVRTGEKVKLLLDPRHQICAGWASPDEHRIVFVFIQRRPVPQWFIAPLRADGAALPDTAWIPVGGNQIRWSPDGNFLYSTSEQDGFPCLYAQRLDPQSKQPVEPLRPIHHFHSARRSVHEDQAWRGVSVAKDKIVITLVDLTSNIWMLEPQGR